MYVMRIRSRIDILTRIFPEWRVIKFALFDLFCRIFRLMYDNE